MMGLLEVRGVALYTPLQHLYSVFERVGPVKHIEVQRDPSTRLRTGVYLVEFYESTHSDVAVEYLNGFMLDDRPLEVARHMQSSSRRSSHYACDDRLDRKRHRNSAREDTMIAFDAPVMTRVIE
ncbi:hypothetical protein PTSG_05465 [Salpingoeca rosetta]|uniref:RRM domain-containing protein n=1 Tax=Salpingoeca rosetta (strain ATCC 50818 / BSB-021) TaxID=946362 RepID=F2UBA6_SALR5|nr:uncharacterized protein PTSG_05465 [Salpingoeca rosetta]EGD73772.1 hypothetical protein PTSG_05465 [Salpingoeca rosetta]|eukprot:XP_004993335.1 hypothetical protein PTSG_05465 [Salpingoeca rosetta]